MAGKHKTGPLGLKTIRRRKKMTMLNFVLLIPRLSITVPANLVSKLVAKVFATAAVIAVAISVAPSPASAQWSVGQQLGQAAAHVAYSAPWTIADIYRSRKQAEVQKIETEARRQVELARTASELGCDVSIRTDGRSSTDVKLGGSTGTRCTGTSQERTQIATESERTRQIAIQNQAQIDQIRAQADLQRAEAARIRASQSAADKAPQRLPDWLR